MRRILVDGGRALSMQGETHGFEPMSGHSGLRLWARGSQVLSAAAEAIKLSPEALDFVSLR